MHLSKLILYQPESEMTLTETFLPLFSSAFSQLKSLCFRRQVSFFTYISEEELELISSMPCLEEFHLIFYEVYDHSDQRNDWRDDHERMRKHLRKLSCLQRLAFSDCDNGYTWHESDEWYYPCKRPESSKGWSFLCLVGMMTLGIWWTICLDGNPFSPGNE